MLQRSAIALLALVGCLTACDPAPDTLYVALPAADHGIDFQNTIPENDSVNIVLFEYIYNGGGVGVGDFDRNGRPDLVFSGNFVSSRMYLQTEEWQFTDVTEPAGLTTNVWCSGVNVADVDGNGWEDIYFSTLNPSGKNDTPNRLYLNQGTNEAGIPEFIEVAATYGLNDHGYGTHSAWFDYENDGDLDLYVLNNAIEKYNRNVAKGTETTGRGKSTDAIYLREGNTFTKTDDIKTEGWGLGVAVQDFNQDGYSDIYVANDFLSDDFLLINQAGRGFRDELRQRLPHQSRNSMGIDVADLTNDGAPEIMVVDMLPDDNRRVKTMFGDIPHHADRTERERGYAQQYIRNTLQFNHGDGTFSDVAFQAGVAATDWSWTPLLADFDNDGDRDIYVSNGYPKDITNKDFIDFSDQATQFGTNESQLKTLRDALTKVDGVHQPNFFFRNDGELRFRQPETPWLPDQPTYSNGSVPVDLDGDGDLDLVTNNINEGVGLLRNQLRERDTINTHFLQLDLQGPKGNHDGLGTKIYLEADTLTLYHEHHRQRGYLSTLPQLVHFGLGSATSVQNLRVVWPDGWTETIRNVPANQRLEIRHNQASPTDLAAPLRRPPHASAARLLPLAPAGLPDHRESNFSDFDYYALALRDRSHDGPAMTTIRLNEREHLVFGGAKGQPVSVHEWNDGALAQVQSLSETAAGECTVLLAFDYDGDGDEDLYVGNGSSEFIGQEQRLRDQLYRNEDGTLVLTTDVLPALYGATSTVSVADFGKDGDLDLFVGSRLQTAQYPAAPTSYLLSNEGGRFTVAQEFREGMITASAFADFTGDERPDLVVAGEYFGPLLDVNHKANFAVEQRSLAGTGWYYSLTPVDLDADGDLDLVAGNVGLNSAYRASPERPLVLLADDFDNNETVDPLVLAYNGDRAHPVHPRNTLGRQLPGWKRMLTSYAAYGAWTADDIPPMSERGQRLEATEFRSLYLENDGRGNFTVHPLPALAQTAPLRAATPTTLPDGRPALLCVQNDYAVEPLGGRLDAGTGFALTLDADGKPEILPHFLTVREDARSIVRLRQDGKDYFFVGVNDGEVKVFKGGSSDTLVQ